MLYRHRALNIDTGVEECVDELVQELLRHITLCFVVYWHLKFKYIGQLNTDYFPLFHMLDTKQYHKVLIADFAKYMPICYSKYLTIQSMV